MKVSEFVLLVLSIAVLNVVVYFAFKTVIRKMENPAMKFLGINVIKDVFWCGLWLYILPREKPVFFILISVFLVASVILYNYVIRSINKL